MSGRGYGVRDSARLHGELNFWRLECPVSGMNSWDTRTILLPIV